MATITVLGTLNKAVPEARAVMSDPCGKLLTLKCTPLNLTEFPALNVTLVTNVTVTTLWFDVPDTLTVKLVP